MEPTVGSRTKYKSQATIGISRTTQEFIGYYASNALHAAPVAQNYLTNLMLYFLTPDLDLNRFPELTYDSLRRKYPIQVHAYNHPIPINEVPNNLPTSRAHCIPVINLRNIYRLLCTGASGWNITRCCQFNTWDYICIFASHDCCHENWLLRRGVLLWCK
jgi:hypothetical protein